LHGVDRIVFIWVQARVFKKQTFEEAAKNGITRPREETRV
jgi:hypothetical protein